VDWLHGCSLGGISQILRRLKIRYRRGREYLHSPDPHYASKLLAVEQAWQACAANPTTHVFVYQDEMTYYRRPSVGYDFGTPYCPQPLAHLGWGHNRKRRISGCLDRATGRLFTWQRSSFKVASLLRFYAALQATYPDAEVIYLVQDNWGVHEHPTLLAWLQSSKIRRLPLPTYAPWTNPIEKVWHLLKRQVLHLHRHADDWSALTQRVQTWLDAWNYPSPTLLTYCGLTPH